MKTFEAGRLLFAAALVCAALPYSVPAAENTALPPNCAKPAYPRESLKQLEEGISVLGLLIRTDGTVGEPVVFSSSGSAPLDEAAQAAFSKCVFRPASMDGTPIETWTEVAFVWFISDDPDMKRAQREAALAAVKGDLAARYRLARLLAAVAKNDADRERALTVLLGAAERGHAHAQYDAGRHYEKGLGVQANIEEALRWYRKAAAQDDLLAIQRLKLGVLPN